MGKDEESIIFDLTLSKTGGVYLNLIAPLHQLMLVATTENRDPDPGNDLIGVNGFLSIPSQKHSNDHIKVMVTKS